ncbi:MAG: hypothetical protein SGJ27_27325, partial [Candidatus Melainabacteria bacterium]|nr:hypothetical protein [Candidatus Melainabacteria bacterium]
FTALGERLKRAIAIKKSLNGVHTEITTSTTKVAGRRNLAAAYQYPIAANETRAQELRSANFLLDEEGANPDTILADAQKSWDSATALVFAAKLDEADAAKSKASGFAAQASKLVDTIVAAKALVESNVPPARTTLASLNKELPDADTAVVELNADFLPANVGTHPTRVKNAHGTAGATIARQMGTTHGAICMFLLHLHATTASHKIQTESCEAHRMSVCTPARFNVSSDASLPNTDDSNTKLVSCRRH